MSNSISRIGFGKAGQAFAWCGARAFDVKIGRTGTRGAMLTGYASAGVEGSPDAGTALVGASAVLVVVTANEALAAARDYAPLLDLAVDQKEPAA